MKLVAEAAFCPSKQQSWNDSSFILGLSFFFFFFLLSLMCKIKGRPSLIVTPCFIMAWSFHTCVQLALAQTVFPFLTALHGGWEKASPQFASPKGVTGWGLLVPEEKRRSSHGCAEELPHEMGKWGPIRESLTSGTRPVPSPTPPCAGRVHVRAELLVGASRSTSRVSSACARAAVCVLARTGTILSA